MANYVCMYVFWELFPEKITEGSLSLYYFPDAWAEFIIHSSYAVSQHLIILAAFSSVSLNYLIDLYNPFYRVQTSTFIA